MVDIEAEKSIKVAETALLNRDFEKAKRFLIKSLKIQRTSQAEKLLSDCERLMSRQSQGSSQTAPPRQTSSAAKPEPEETKKNYSDDDKKICEEILQKSDYYEIIGVPKSAPEDEIKKKYKKLALKLHPDKNHCPLATEAFKKVTQAFACLTDKNKRVIYDEHGSEQNFRQQYHEYFRDEEQFDPDDIFEMFFTGHVNPNRRRRYQARTYYNYRPQNEENQQENNGMVNGRFRNLLQFAPFLLIIIGIFAMQNNRFGPQKNYENLFSFERSSEFSIERFTQNANIEYYVRRNFYKEYQGNQETLLEIENQVEQNYLRVLANQCRYIMQAQKYIEYQLQNSGISNKERQRLEKELKGLDYEPCTKYQRLKNAI